MSSLVLGLDIGGANLKAATSDGRAASVPFALWKQPDGLPQALAALVDRFPDVERLAVTMTGELCDCFETKAIGVESIVQAVESIQKRPAHYWATTGQFLNAQDAITPWELVAAANWHALATYAGRLAPNGQVLLVDVGTTTTDVIPIRKGVPCSEGRTDDARLNHGELIYTGVKRTPLCALLPAGSTCAEFFATSHDANLLLGHLPEEPDNIDTADNRPATKPFAHARIARMIGGDGTTLPEARTILLAEQAIAKQLELVRGAIAQHVQPTVILSGSGEWFARRAIEPFLNRIDTVVSFTELHGRQLASCAPAYAVAKLL